MKKHYFLQPLFFLFFIFSNAALFAQPVHWLREAGGISVDEGNDISIDANGNTYTTGYFSGTANFGGITLTSSGLTDIFIAKVDSMGTYKWVMKAGGTGSDRGLAIKTDAAGNSYVTGFYYNTATFGSTPITSAGLQDVFIAKYNTSGVLQWVKSAGGADSDIGNGISVDVLGNVVVTGEFKGTSAFGASSLTSMSSSIDVFTTKLDASGAFQWVEQGAGTSIDRGIDVSCDLLGNIYVTGQFTDTITFDAVHYNTIYNAIFVIKYNSAGVEQWFNKIGGGIFNAASGIASDALGNVYVSGDFTGNLTFFGPPPVIITNPRANKIFTGKYDTNGNFLWGHADGSNAEFNARNLALDAAGNPYMIGSFKCLLDDYAAQYGQGTFNSVGYWDVFITKLSTAGTWLWSRQYGGKQNDFGNGITVNATGEPIFTGSYTDKFIWPEPGNNIPYSTGTLSYSSTHCGDAAYGKYRLVNNAGASDIMIGKITDPNKSTFDYYYRQGSDCSRPYVGVCISNSNTMFSVCHDTLDFCGQGSLFAYTGTSIFGPDYTWLWSTGATGGFIFPSTSGYYSVTQTSADGCFVSTDSIYVVIHPFPPRPTITDDHGVNTNALVTQVIHVCEDSVLLTGGNYGTNAHWWASSVGDHAVGTTITATESGYYYFSDSSSFGCTISNVVQVIIDTAVNSINPEMVCLTDTDHNDSITVCYGEAFSMFIYDSISNPLGNLDCLQNTTVTWSVTPTAGISYSPVVVNCPATYTANTFSVTLPGLYVVNAMVVQQTFCNNDTTYVTDSIYVDVLPIPTLSLTADPFYICPGDSTVIIATGADTYLWSNGSTNDSIWVTAAGTYSVLGTLLSSGCRASSAFGVMVYPNTSATITMLPSNGLICPGGAVELFCSGTGTFTWEGPSGPIPIDSSHVFVNIPGLYYCIRTDTSGCGFVNTSNSVQINQYATPYIVATNAVLCPGGTVDISVAGSDTSDIVWQAPLSGNALTQHITSPGTYTCTITTCGIVTTSSITVTLSSVVSNITAGGPLSFCVGDSVVLTGNSGMSNYNWMPGGSGLQSITVLASGTYTLTTTDSSGCTQASAPVTISATTAPVVTVNSPSVCAGSATTLTAGGSSAYQWSNGAGTSSITITPTTSTTYTVSSTGTGCPGTAVSSVTVNPVPVVSVNSTTVCAGQLATLSATGATGFSWSTGSGSSTIGVTPLTTTSYTVTGTSGGCSASATALVTVNPVPAITVNSPTICLGHPVTLSAFGAGAYLWSTGAGTSSVTVSPAVTTAYTVAGTTSGCTGSAIATVTVVPDTLVVPAVSDLTICAGEPALLTASGNGTIEWYTAAGGATPVFTGPEYSLQQLLTTTTYYVYSSSPYCRSGMDSVTVTVDYCDNVIIPNVFTPNGDGENDVFYFGNMYGALCFDCEIYNRWGILIYKWQSAAEGWDGTIMRSGKPASDGVYYYILHYCRSNNEKKEAAGFLQLIRE